MPGFRRAFILEMRQDLALVEDDDAGRGEDGIAFRDRQYDLLAGHFRAHIDLAKLCAIADPDGALRLADRVLTSAPREGGLEKGR